MDGEPGPGPAVLCWQSGRARPPGQTPALGMARPGLGQAAQSGGLVSRGEGSLLKQPSVPSGHKSAHRGLDMVCSEDLGPILQRDTQHSWLGGQPSGPSPGESKHLPPLWGLVPSRLLCKARLPPQF